MVTIWHPAALDDGLPRYQAIAAALSDDIGRGRLSPGDRLPTMRALAEALGVTLGTVYRAYALAERRGQISRQKGRGSFVRGRDGVTGDAEAATGVVDLSRNEPPDLRIEETLRRSLIEMARECDLAGMLSYGNSQGQPRHRDCLARWVRRHGFAADPALTIITSGAQQALTVALGALSQPGDTLLVEALTYPGIKNLARIFGLRLQAVAIDAEGLLPEALSAACRAGRPRMLYCMPNLHNPTTATLGAPRRGEIARIAAEHGLIVVEDDVNPRRSASPPPPIATLYPERSVYISSLSKTMAPGLRVGALCSPPALFSELLAAAQTTNWMAPPLMAELASRWIEDGTAELLEEERDRAARRLQEIAASCLAGLDHRSAEDSWNLWLPLPAGWSGRDFAAKALERGVIVTAGEDFAIDPVQPVPAVRICLSEVGTARLGRALGEIARLAGSGPGPVAFAM